MKNRASFSRGPLLILGAALCLSSCALPPREAWRVIQRDGLIPYLAIETGKRPIPGYVRSVRPSAAHVSSKQSSSVVARVPVAPRAPVVVPAPQTRYFTTPGAAPAPTHRPAGDKPKIVAHATKPQPAHRAAPAPASPPLEFRRAAPARESAAAPRSSLTIPAPKRETPAAPAPPKIAQAPKTQAPKPTKETPAPAKKLEAPKVDTPRSVAETTPKPKEQPAAPKAASAPGVDIPYGNAVPGRPGLVTSPYAGKMQLVDVTGLSPGQEVKCPYSGKLFRVPPSQQAAATPAPPTAADAPPAKKNP